MSNSPGIFPRINYFSFLFFSPTELFVQNGEQTAAQTTQTTPRIGRPAGVVFILSECGFTGCFFFSSFLALFLLFYDAAIIWMVSDGNHSAIFYLPSLQF